MSKNKPKTKEARIVKKHDFSHLTRTKAAAKIVSAETVIADKTKSPLDKLVKKDLQLTTIVLGVFVIAIVALWLIVGRNGEIFTLADKINLFK